MNQVFTLWSEIEELDMKKLKIIHESKKNRKLLQNGAKNGAKIFLSKYGDMPKECLYPGLLAIEKLLQNDLKVLKRHCISEIDKITQKQQLLEKKLATKSIDENHQRSNMGHCQCGVGASKHGTMQDCLLWQINSLCDKFADCSKATTLASEKQRELTAKYRKVKENFQSIEQILLKQRRRTLHSRWTAEVAAPATSKTEEKEEKTDKNGSAAPVSSTSEESWHAYVDKEKMEQDIKIEFEKRKQQILSKPGKTRKDIKYSLKIAVRRDIEDQYRRQALRRCVSHRSRDYSRRSRFS